MKYSKMLPSKANYLTVNFVCDSTASFCFSLNNENEFVFIEVVGVLYNCCFSSLLCLRAEREKEGEKDAGSSCVQIWTL